MKKVLITGGPVHAHLDAVKIITNEFEGGLMVDLAEKLAEMKDIEVTYLCKKKNSAKPKNPNIIQIYHDGFNHYREIVKSYAPFMDTVILGAAVANLIPENPWKGKFPSHNYKEGDIIPINFMITPRVINEVKLANPKVNLFGFKLLSNVEREYLIDVAYDTLLESKANAIIANDKSNLLQKYIVTKEKGVHPVNQEELALWLYEAINDEYYHTKKQSDTYFQPPQELKDIIRKWNHRFVVTNNGYFFGTVAVRGSNGGFWTTHRGKKEIEDFVEVLWVNHVEKTVVINGNKKATLNAPLLDRIFKGNPDVHSIVHFHGFYNELDGANYMLPYAPPGTVRDTMRELEKIESSFHINEHGAFLLFDKKGDII